MRRAALRGCALLLRHSGGAAGPASDPAALLAVCGPTVAAGGRHLWAPWLQAPLHAAAPSTQQAGSDSGSEGNIEWVKRSNGRSAPLPVQPQLAAELRPLAALARAELLLSLGLPRAQLPELLLQCPLLFSRPERAKLLFGQLARLGLTVAEAARCFMQHPSAANPRSFEPAVAVLAPLFAAGGSSAGGGKSGEQLLGDLLRKQPGAVGLLERKPATLQQRISNLVQRYGPHWEQENKEAVIVRALQQQHWSLLTIPPVALLAREAVLQQELGQQPGDGTRQLATIVQHHARVAGCSPETLRQRARALVAEFGRERLLQASLASLAELLAVDVTTWQRALAVWRLLGVADPAALGMGNTRSLVLNWLKPGNLANLMALQLLPWQPTATDAVQQFHGYVVNYTPQRLIGRLLFVQQEGLLPLLVADKQAALQQVRRQRRLRAGQPADQPLFISLSDVGKLPNANFFSVLAAAGAAQPEQPAGRGSSSSGSSSVAERYRAFMEQLPQLPAYQRLLAAGEAESRRLAALLPPELAATERKGIRGKQQDTADDET